MIMYEFGPHATINDEPSLTETEHGPSCDINHMMRNIHRGLMVRGGAQPVYGEDDLTLDAVSFRIQKQQLEEELMQEAIEPIDEEIYKRIPQRIREKFGFKVKANPAKRDDELNNDATNAVKPEQPKTKETL